MNGANDILDPHLGFDEITVGTESFAAGTLVLAGECGHHNNLDVLGLGSAPENVEHVKATNLWHHHVTDNQVRTFFDSHSQGLFAITS